LTEFIYTGILVSNIERSIRFYTRELGMKLLFKTRIKETGGRVAWLRTRRSSQILELNWYPTKYKYGGKSGLDHLAFQVTDVNASYEKIRGRYKGPIKPFKEGKWMLAYVKDPDGNWIELGQRIKAKRKK